MCVSVRPPAISHGPKKAAYTSCGWGTRFLTHNTQVSLQWCIHLCWRYHWTRPLWVSAFLSYVKSRAKMEVEFSVFAAPRGSLPGCLGPAPVRQIPALSHLKGQGKVSSPCGYCTGYSLSRKGLPTLVEGPAFPHWDISLAACAGCPWTQPQP